MKAAVLLSVLVAMAAGNDLTVHCQGGCSLAVGDEQYFVMARCCIGTPGYTHQERVECTATVASLTDLEGAFDPTADQMVARFGVSGWRSAYVNGAVKEMQVDTVGAEYIGSTNMVDGAIDFAMSELPPTKKYNPRDILECYILRPLDNNSYKENQITVQPGEPIDTGSPITMQVVYGTSTLSLPLVASKPSNFVFGSNVITVEVNNTDHYSLLVNANVLAKFAVLPGETAQIETYCTTEAVLGK